MTPDAKLTPEERSALASAFLRAHDAERRCELPSFTRSTDEPASLATYDALVALVESFLANRAQSGQSGRTVEPQAGLVSDTHANMIREARPLGRVSIDEIERKMGEGQRVEIAPDGSATEVTYRRPTLTEVAKQLARVAEPSPASPAAPAAVRGEMPHEFGGWNMHTDTAPMTSDRAPLDLDAIEAQARDALDGARIELIEEDEIAANVLALVARVRALEKVAEAATEVARHIRCEQHAGSDYTRRCCIYCALRRALAEAGYKK